MRFLLKFARAVDQISEIGGKIAVGLVFLLVVIGFYNVLVRYLGRFTGMQLSSNVFIETQWYLYSLIFLLAFGYILRHGDNVRVDLMYARWSRRTQMWVDLIGTAFFLIPFTILGMWVTVNPVLVSWGRKPDGSWGVWEMSPDPGGLPRAPIKTFIIIAFLMLFLQAIAQVIKYIAVLQGNEEVAREIQRDTKGHGELIE
ncbi:MAG: TRAP transporter small permease subunit [Caldilineae bacterium]|nr:MAG: TRAP transporter small permease subunit [Caldilineae bacterium]